MYQKSLFYRFISYLYRCLSFFVDIQTRTGTFSDVIDKTYNQDNQYINNPPRYPYINPKTLYDISVIGIDSYQYSLRISWSRFRACSRTQNKNPDNNTYLRFFSRWFFSCYSVIFFSSVFWDFFIFDLIQDFRRKISNPPLEIFFDPLEDFFRSLEIFFEGFLKPLLEIFFWFTVFLKASLEIFFHTL